MRRGRPTEQVVLDEKQRTALQSFAGSAILMTGLRRTRAFQLRLAGSLRPAQREGASQQPVAGRIRVRPPVALEDVDVESAGPRGWRGDAFPALSVSVDLASRGGSDERPQYGRAEAAGG